MKRIDNMRNKAISFLSVLILTGITIVFFIINRNTFFVSDDWSVRAQSIHDVINHVITFYMTWGGGYITWFLQSIFTSVLSANEKIVFDICNTAVFIYFIHVSVQLILLKRSCASVSLVLLLMVCYALSFWFICPAPNETLFWLVGATGYLWPNTMCLIFLLLYQKYAEESPLSRKSQALLGLLSFFLASSMIADVSICGAFVVYYLFNLRKLKGNSLWMVIGFALGSMVMVFAPGNFVRQEVLTELLGESSFLHLFNPYRLVREAANYSLVWIGIAIWLFWCKRDKSSAKEWVREHIILLLTLSWSMIAFSFVFTPAPRALFFTSALSLILMFKLVLSLIHSIKPVMVISAILLIGFIFDSSIAIRDTNYQKLCKDEFMEELINNDGVACLPLQPNVHRMAWKLDYPEWAWTGMAQLLQLDSVHVYKYYHCQILSDEILNPEYSQEDLHAFVSADNYLVLRFDSSENSNLGDRVKISYTLPKSWHRDIRAKFHMFNYIHSREVNIKELHCVHNNYFYYVEKDPIGKKIENVLLVEF